MPGYGIVVVGFGSGGEIGPCLDRVLETGAPAVVVDNSADPRSREETLRRGLPLIENPANLGFAAAVNQGIEALREPLILLLNADVYLETGIDLLAAACENPATAGASGTLVGPGGAQRGFMVRRLPTPLALGLEVLLVNRLWPGNPVNWHYRCMGLDYARSQDVEQPAAAFLMIRRDVWSRLGGFDAGFWPLWFEDVDFCARARRLGYRFRFVPGVVAKHTGGHTVGRIPLEQRQLYWYGNLLRYAAKHFSNRARALVVLAVMTGSVMRMVMGIARQWSLAPVVVFGKVAAMAGREAVRLAGLR
ncbi:MAG: glycosyltransferase family 2 protein [Acidobacteria bacterium]|nr:glycosyltransferase family 2 protein [Acidobacteriota bacterium]